MIHLASYQYYLVALASDDQRLRLPKGDRLGAAPVDDIIDQDLDYHYRIVLPRISEYVPLPSYALQWTSIAYLVWDDIHPDLLKPEQARRCSTGFTGVGSSLSAALRHSIRCAGVFWSHISLCLATPRSSSTKKQSLR